LILTNLLTLIELKADNAMLKARIKDLQQQLDRVTKELQESRELNETILMINEEFGRENDDLYKKLEQYKGIRKPRSMQKRRVSKRKRSHSRSDNEEHETGSSSDENSSDDTHATNVTESNEKSARVCIYIYFFLIRFYANIYRILFLWII
jgi:TolA-binding protein